MNNDDLVVLVDQLQDLLCSGKLTRFLAKPRRLPQCWKVLGCKKKRCPSYGGPGVRCWHVVGTLCGSPQKGDFSFLTKSDDCRRCPIYRSATATKTARITEGLLNIAHLLRTTVDVSDHARSDANSSLPSVVARYGLSLREAQALSHLCERRSRREIAASMGISEETVKMHVKHLYRKLGLSSSRRARKSLLEVIALCDGSDSLKSRSIHG